MARCSDNHCGGPGGCLRKVRAWMNNSVNSGNNDLGLPFDAQVKWQSLQVCKKRSSESS